MQRFGASVTDIASQNFFGDFVLASAFHEDPRYVRKGPTYGLWPRVGYAVSRSIIIRTHVGGTSFNWSNVLGTAMSAGSRSDAVVMLPSSASVTRLRNWQNSILPILALTTGERLLTIFHL